MTETEFEKLLQVGLEQLGPAKTIAALQRCSGRVYMRMKSELASRTESLWWRFLYLEARDLVEKLSSQNH